MSRVGDSSETHTDPEHPIDVLLVLNPVDGQCTRAVLPS